MSLLSDLLSPFTKVKDAVEALVPQSMLQAYGNYAHTIAANLVHDAAVAAKAGVAEAEKLSAPLLASIMTAVEQEVASVAPGVLSGKVPFATAVEGALTNLKSEAVISLVPALKVIGKTTLQTVLSTAMSTAVATVAANPPLTSVSVPAASSAA